MGQVLDIIQLEFGTVKIQFQCFFCPPSEWRCKYLSCEFSMHCPTQAHISGPLHSIGRNIEPHTMSILFILCHTERKSKYFWRDSRKHGPDTPQTQSWPLSLAPILRQHRQRLRPPPEITRIEPPRPAIPPAKPILNQVQNRSREGRKRVPSLVRLIARPKNHGEDLVLCKLSEPPPLPVRKK